MDKKKLLVKFFNGECSSEEKQDLLDLLHDEDVEYTEVMENLWDDFNTYPELKETASERIYRKIQKEAKIRAYSKVFKFYPIAASILVAGVLAALSVFFYGRRDIIEHQTAYGEKKVIVLPDSSIVTLNANSILKYNESSFSGLVRKVWLSGEAFFDVKKRTWNGKRSQFIVRSNKLKIEVLGTKFNVNSRRETTKVVLESGKVLLSVQDDARKKLVMQPGDMVAYSGIDKELKVKKVNPEHYSGWKKNTLIHHDGVTVKEIARTIKDNFGYDVIIEDQTIQKKIYKGVFPAENIDVLLQSLSRSFDLVVVKENGKIILKKDNNLHQKPAGN